MSFRDGLHEWFTTRFLHSETRYRQRLIFTYPDTQRCILFNETLNNTPCFIWQFQSELFYRASKDRRLLKKPPCERRSHNLDIGSWSMALDDKLGDSPVASIGARWRFSVAFDFVAL